MIIGTHNSFINNLENSFLKSILGFFVINQKYNIKKQFALGCRFFDVRISQFNNKIYITHRFKAYKLLEVIDDLNSLNEPCFISIKEDFDNVEAINFNNLDEILKKINTIHQVLSVDWNILKLNNVKQSFPYFWINSSDPEKIVGDIIKNSNLNLDQQQINLIGTPQTIDIVKHYIIIILIIILSIIITILFIIFIMLLIIKSSYKRTKYIILTIIIILLITNIILIIIFDKIITYKSVPNKMCLLILKLLNERKIKLNPKFIYCLDYLDEEKISLLTKLFN
jgi:hypothetical protein